MRHVNTGREDILSPRKNKMSNIYKRAFGLRAVKRSLKMKFRVDVTQVVPLLPRKGVDEATVPQAEKAAPSMC